MKAEGERTIGRKPQTGDAHAESFSEINAIRASAISD